MKLSPQNRVLLDLLIKQERQWYRLRYWNLALGIVCLLMGFGGFFFLLATSREAATRLGDHPAFYLLAMAGGAGIGFAIRGWKGNTAHRLLISIVNELASNEQNKA